MSPDSNPNLPNDPAGRADGVFFYSPPPYRPRWWLHVLLFFLTLASTTFIGALFWGDLPAEMATWSLLEIVVHPAFIRAGLSFSIPLLTILLCHEMGHYLACRANGLVATPPFFIPFPLPIFGIGTLGAVIRVKEPIRNKRQLLDVGAAGPIAGFVALIPFLAYGISASRLTTATPDSGYLIFGEPLIYGLLESVLHPQLADGATLLLHPTGVAAWFGILITLLNLLPFAQLDGGHVAYALFGARHRRLAWPLVGGLVVLGFWWPGWWLWAVIAIVMGPRHPPIWDEGHRLDPLRRAMAWATVAIFVMCFMVVPIELFM